MGTNKVVLVEDPDDLTIAHAQPEVTSPEAALLSNISAISCRPVLVMKKAEVLGENHRPWTSNW
jgi:hypothetical protein